MVNGEIGATGESVTSLVGVEVQAGQDCATIQPHLELALPVMQLMHWTPKSVMSNCAKVIQMCKNVLPLLLNF